MGVVSQPHAPAASTPGQDPVPILQEVGWAPGPVWTGEKSRPHRDLIPDHPASCQSLNRLSSTPPLQFTLIFRKSHRQPQRTLQLMCEDRVLFVWLDLHVSLCGPQHPKYEPAIRLVYPPLVCKLPPSSNSTNKNLIDLGMQIQPAPSL